MRALWIEDHALIGDSLEVLLQVVMPEVSLDKARDVPTAANLVRTIAYDLVLLDWWIGADAGDRAISRLRGVGCNAPILVVSGDDREVVRQRALAMGAAGFIPKAASPQTLVGAIRAGLADARSAPTQDVGGAAAPIERPTVPLGSIFPELTERQVEVLEHLARGLADKQIAKKLGVAPNTVRSHVRTILEVVGVHSRGEAAHEARVRGAGGL